MLERLRKQQPLIHCITNHVVSNFQANGLLALGVSPMMGDEQREVADLTGHADALSLNIGTISERSFHSMIIAGQAATEKGIPIVLDPVGAGASTYRLKSVQTLLEQVEIRLLRCNSGELAAIAGVDWQARGVDAGEGDADLATLAKAVAVKYETIVAVTGAIDIVTDGERVEQIEGGHPAMAKVTGMGCLLSSVTAAFLTDEETSSMEAAIQALRFYANAGERAARTSHAPGSFQVAFLDQLAQNKEAISYEH